MPGVAVAAIGGCTADTQPAGPRDATVPDTGGEGQDAGPACRSALTECGDRCLDTSSDVEHCGECGNACEPGEVCFSGSCSAEGCPETTTDCGGSCVDTDTSDAHCGGCGNECGAEQVCDAGTCVCEGDLTSCGSECVDTSSSRLHCGECGNACASGGGCMDGTCVDCGPEATLSGEVQPIFTETCAVMGCHRGRAPSGELSLERGQSHGDLVGVPSSGCTGRTRVEAGSPDTSYLLDKLRGGDSLCAGKQMPLREPELSSSQIALIESWICRGAMND